MRLRKLLGHVVQQGPDVNQLVFIRIDDGFGIFDGSFISCSPAVHIIQQSLYLFRTSYMIIRFIAVTMHPGIVVWWHCDGCRAAL